jgi:hypothetical protein
VVLVVGAMLGVAAGCTSEDPGETGTNAGKPGGSGKGGGSAGGGPRGGSDQGGRAAVGGTAGRGGTAGLGGAAGSDAADAGGAGAGAGGSDADDECPTTGSVFQLKGRCSTEGKVCVDVVHGPCASVRCVKGGFWWPVEPYLNPACDVGGEGGAGAVGSSGAGGDAGAGGDSGAGGA